MSGIPPTLDPTTGSPAGEWAARTTSALNPSRLNQNNSTSMNPTTAELFGQKPARPAGSDPLSTASTPGFEFPGAYPRETPPFASHNTAPNTTSVTAKEPSLPSQEVRGAQPFEHAGGVGALHGFRNESGVAILPTERDTAADRERRVGALGTGFGTGATAGAGTQGFATTHSNSNPFAENTTPGFASNTNTNSNQGFAANTNTTSNPFAANTTPGFAANMDTNPSSNQAPVLSRTNDRSNPGIGESEDMAERARAAGAEKARDMTAHTTSTQDARTSTGTPARTEKQRGNDNAAAIGTAAGVGEMQKHEQKAEQKQRGNESAAAIGAAAGVGEMKKHERNEAPATAPAQKHTPASHASKGAAGSGYDPDYHPAAQHPAAPHSAAAAQDAKDDNALGHDTNETKYSIDGQPRTDGNGEARNSEGQALDEDGQPKKVGLMAKMKGEALTLIGKVEGKKGEAKVEEGQRIKAGLPPTDQV